MIEWNRGGGVQGSLAREGGLYLDIGTGTHEFLVTPLLMGPVCLLSQSQSTPLTACLHSHLLIWRRLMCDGNVTMTVESSTNTCA